MTYKVIVCGGREYKGRYWLYTELDRIHAEVKITHVIHGGAPGADSFAGQWAMHRGVQEVKCQANWAKFSKAAGMRRNRLMAELAPNAVIAFPGGPGTAGMVWIARELNIQVLEIPDAPTTR